MIRTATLTLTIAMTIAAAFPCKASAKDNLIKVAGNGCISRTVNCADGHVLTSSYCVSDDVRTSRDSECLWSEAGTVTAASTPRHAAEVPTDVK